MVKIEAKVTVEMMQKVRGGGKGKDGGEGKSKQN